MAKSTSNKADETTATNGMMPAQTLDMEAVSHVIKTVGGIGSALGVTSTLALPAIMLFAVLLPTVLAPLSSFFNTVLLAYIGYRVLRKTGYLPALFGKKQLGEDTKSRRATR